MSGSVSPRGLSGLLCFAPQLAGLPILLIPESLRKYGLVGCLNRLFSEQIEEGGLDFFDGKCLEIKVLDVSLSFRIGQEQRRFIITEQEPDCTFSGSLADFILLAAGREDPDTLFFQRRLVIEGDTEFGLGIKNFLYTVEPDEQFPLIYKALEKIADVVEVVESARHSLEESDPVT